MSSFDTSRTEDSGSVGAEIHGHDEMFWRLDWLCEKWSQEAVDFCRNKLEKQGVTEIQDGVQIHFTGEKVWSNELQMDVAKYLVVPQMISVRHGITSDILRELVGEPEECVEIQGNLLVNEGIQRLEDLLIAAGGVAYNNANAFVGVGDSATAEAATQTELQAATNRFYKAMVATYPQRPGSNGSQSVDWRSDFTTTEANYACRSGQFVPVLLLLPVPDLRQVLQT